MTTLDEAFAIESVGAGRWTTIAHPLHESITGMFGGWTTAVTLNAVCQTSEAEMVPAAMAINFVGRIDGGTQVALEPVRLGGGKSVEHWRVDVREVDSDRVGASAMVTLAARRPSDGHVQVEMPDSPDPDELEEVHAPSPQGDQTILRMLTGYPWFATGNTSSAHWVKDLSGRPVDHLQVAYIADQLPPRSFAWREEAHPSASLTMSVHFLATPAEIAAIGDDYVLVDADGTRGADSTSGHHARLWSRDGTLLATTDQLALFR
jgi:acyl-CoA thioesterase